MEKSFVIPEGFFIDNKNFNIATLEIFQVDAFLEKATVQIIKLYSCSNAHTY